MNLSNKFYGDNTLYYKTKSFLYFYEKASRSLFRMDIQSKRVDIVFRMNEAGLDDESLFYNVVQYRNKIILIPNEAEKKWIVYALEDSRIFFFKPIKKKIVLAEVYIIDDLLYLLPNACGFPIVSVNADDFKIYEIHDNWYPGGSEKFFCWGYLYTGGRLFYPIIGANNVYVVNEKRLISFDKSLSITSISSDKNGLWVLTDSGNKIYECDLNGKILSTLDFPTDVDSADYVRIVQYKGWIILIHKELPFVRMINLDDGKSYKADIKDELLRYAWFYDVNQVPFYYSCELSGRMYLLAKRYPMVWIDFDNRRLVEEEMYCGNFSMEQYSKWVSDNPRYFPPVMQEFQSDYLKGFIRLICE